MILINKTMKILDLKLLKFSGWDCGTCHRMSAYDSQVTEELGLEFLLISNDDPNTWNKYQKIFHSTPQEGRGFPMYLLVSNAEDEKLFSILGDIKGGMSKGEYRDRLSSLIKRFR